MSETERVAFLQSLNESMKLGALKMLDPVSKKYIEIGGKEWLKLFKKYDLVAEEDSSSAASSSEDEEPIVEEVKKMSLSKKLKSKRGIVASTEGYSPHVEPEMSDREKFMTNPTINPKTGKEIKKDSPTYKKLVKEFGNPFSQ